MPGTPSDENLEQRFGKVWDKHALMYFEREMRGLSRIIRGYRSPNGRDPNTLADDCSSARAIWAMARLAHMPEHQDKVVQLRDRAREASQRLLELAEAELPPRTRGRPKSGSDRPLSPQPD